MTELWGNPKPATRRARSAACSYSAINAFPSTLGGPQRKRFRLMDGMGLAPNAAIPADQDERVAQPASVAAASHVYVAP